MNVSPFGEGEKSSVFWYNLYVATCNIIMCNLREISLVGIWVLILVGEMAYIGLYSGTWFGR